MLGGRGDEADSLLVYMYANSALFLVVKLCDIILKKIRVALCLFMSQKAAGYVWLQ